MPKLGNGSRKRFLQQYDQAEKKRLVTGIVILLCLGSPLLGFIWSAAVNAPAEPKQQIMLAFIGMLLFLLAAIHLHNDTNREVPFSTKRLVRVSRLIEVLCHRSCYLILAGYLTTFGVEGACKKQASWPDAIHAGVLIVSGLSIAWVCWWRLSKQEIIARPKRAFAAHTILIAAIVVCGRISVRHSVVDELKTHFALPSLVLLSLGCTPVLIITWISRLVGVLRGNRKVKAIVTC